MTTTTTPTFGVDFVQRDDEVSLADLHELPFQELARPVPPSNAQYGRTVKDSGDHVAAG